MQKNHSLKLRIGVALFIFITFFSHFGPQKVATANNQALPISGESSSAPGYIQTVLIHTPNQDIFPVPTQRNNPTSSLTPTQPPTTPTTVVSDIPSGFEAFRKRVMEGQPGTVRGVYVDGILGLRVIQQPQGNWEFVSQENGSATQFQSTGKNVIGLLAHNYLDGKLFFNLLLGQQVYIVYGDGRFARYKITDIQQYQKVDSSSLFSDLIDVKTGERLSVNKVINRVYYGPDHITFQTCIEKGGDWSWGLLFVIATPS